MVKKIVTGILAIVFFYFYHQVLGKIAGFFNIFVGTWETILATISYYLMLVVITAGTVYLVVKVLESES
ncbi:MAG: hypothetical protein GX357_04300 [Firmicutes bacterium]|nr:hypothetical protein [Bacillota bacterium]